tara:strand:- start:6340 stop:7269 length:930 start_codon:yes stop_codon:yes gene_type:complete
MSYVLYAREHTSEFLGFAFKMNAISIMNHVEKSTLMLLFNMTIVKYPLNKSTPLVVARAVCDGHMILPAYEDAVRLTHKVGGGSALVVAPPLDIVRTLEGNKNGKAETYTWLQNKGMQKYTIRRYTTYGRGVNFSSVQYPVIVKPIMGGGGRNVYLVRNLHELNKVLKQLRHERIIIEEAIDNRQEWALHFSAYRGYLTGAMCILFDFADQFGIRKTHTQQPVNVTQAVNCPSPVFAATNSIVQASKYHGVGCLSGKFKGQQFKILDINPRICNMAARYGQGQFMRTFLLLVKNESARIQSKKCAQSPR